MSAQSLVALNYIPTLHYIHTASSYQDRVGQSVSYSYHSVLTRMSLWCLYASPTQVMMWELFVGQRPYGNMSQQKVVEEVVLRGLRPSFPVGTPLGYTQLACSCWHATAGQRPSFQDVVGRLQVRGGLPCSQKRS